MNQVHPSIDTLDYYKNGNRNSETFYGVNGGLDTTYTNSYDANGFLVGAADSIKTANNRSLVNDATGRVLYTNQCGNVHRQLIVNGAVRFCVYAREWAVYCGQSA